MQYGKLIIDFSGYPSAQVLTVQIDGKTWRREGYCCRCGDCCHGPDYFHNPETGKCKMLHFETDGNGETQSYCDVYWDRPMGCMLYPFNPQNPLPERCTYRWVKNG